MTSTRLPLPTWAALALAGALCVSGDARAADTTLTYSASFTASGGDARYGVGSTADPNVNLVVYDLLPLFDPSLGVLERVSFTLSGWRSFDGVCTSPATAENPGGCSARIDGAFFLDGLNLNTWPQAAPMASINPVTLNLTTAFPAIGSALPINIYAAANASGEITDAVQLASIFTASGDPGAHPQNGIRLRFSPQDGGYFGMGGGAGFTAMLWDADATASVSYHYTATVVPEPGSLALWLAGGAVVAGVARRRSA